MREDEGRKRDFFDWIGVVVNVVQMFIFAGVALGALYWYVLKPGGQAAVILMIAIFVVAIAFCVAYLLYAYISQRRA